MTTVEKLRSEHDELHDRCKAVNECWSTEQSLPGDLQKKLTGWLARMREIKDKLIPAAEIEDALRDQIKALDSSHAAYCAEQSERDIAPHNRPSTIVQNAYNKIRLAPWPILGQLVTQIKDGGSIIAWLRGQRQTIRNDQTTTSPAQGGYLVHDEWYSDVLYRISEIPTLLNLVDVVQVDKGVPVHIPIVPASSGTAYKVAEGALAPDTQFSVGEIVLTMIKVSTGVAKITRELLQDSSHDVLGILNRFFSLNIALYLNRAFTIGDGGEPAGILNEAGAGITTAAPDAITYEELIQMEASVNHQFRNRLGAGWMMHDTTRMYLMRALKGDGSPLYRAQTPGLVPGAEAETLLGRPIYINNHMPVMAAGASPILFGDFKQYSVYSCRALSLQRIENDSNLTPRDQIGFVGFTRWGGRLIDSEGVKKLTLAAA